MALWSIEKIANGARLGIWKKEESLAALKSVFLLNKAEQPDYNKISNESRKKEWLTTRILLTELLHQRVTIYHNSNRKPYLKNHSSNISISHSKNFVVIILAANHYPGVDVENISDRVEKVKHKFLQAEELDWCTTVDLMTACWSAKEAIFKIYEKELDFHDMLVSPFHMSSYQGSFPVKVLKKEQKADYLVNYRLIENDVVTYALSRSTLS